MKDSTARYKYTLVVRPLQPLANLPATIFATIFVQIYHFQTVLTGGEAAIHGGTILTATPHKHVLMPSYSASTICNMWFSKSFTFNVKYTKKKKMIYFANRLDTTLVIGCYRLRFSPPPRSMYAHVC